MSHKHYWMFKPKKIDHHKVTLEQPLTLKLSEMIYNIMYEILYLGIIQTKSNTIYFGNRVYSSC